MHLSGGPLLMLENRKSPVLFDLEILANWKIDFGRAIIK